MQTALQCIRLNQTCLFGLKPARQDLLLENWLLRLEATTLATTRAILASPMERALLAHM